jgi:hypothetical protein
MVLRGTVEEQAHNILLACFSRRFFNESLAAYTAAILALQLSIGTADARANCSNVSLECVGCCAEGWEHRENRSRLPAWAQMGRAEKVPEISTVFSACFTFHNPLNISVLPQFSRRSIAHAPLSAVLGFSTMHICVQTRRILLGCSSCLAEVIFVVESKPYRTNQQKNRLFLFIGTLLAHCLC